MKQRATAYASAAILLCLVISVLVFLRNALNQTTIALALVVVVAVVAAKWGRGPALSTAIFAGVGFNFFFLQPYHTLTIGEPQDVAAFIAFLSTALVVGQLATRLQHRTAMARQQEVDLDRKAAEAEGLRRGEQLKSALLEAVTHDLRTPLTSIKAAASTLRSPSLSSPARGELIDVIEQESDRLNHFVQGMMEMAQLRAGSVSIVSRSVTAEEIIENAIARAEPLLRHRKVNVSGDTDLSLRADPRLVAQVLFTLLENAVNYSPQCSPVSIGVYSVSDKTIVFSVADCGPGIPMLEREQVFQRFHRGRHSNGMGLGLAIAHGIVEAHGGSIWVEAGNSVGADVRFSIPDGSER